MEEGRPGFLSRNVLPQGLVELFPCSFSDQDADGYAALILPLSLSTKLEAPCDGVKPVFLLLRLSCFLCGYNPIEDGYRCSPHPSRVSVSVRSRLAAGDGSVPTPLAGTFLSVHPVVFTGISSVRTAPHQLAYFNEIVGGPDRGYYYLSDSNLDWGQDLKS